MGQKWDNLYVNQCHLMPSTLYPAASKKPYSPCSSGLWGFFALVHEHNRRMVISFRPKAAFEKYTRCDLRRELAGLNLIHWLTDNIIPHADDDRFPGF